MSGRLTRMLRLFVPGSVRSREGARWCHIDDLPSGSYNHQLLRSRAEGDFVTHPDYLWSPTPYWTVRGGLNGHVRELADTLGGMVTSDVLIVLNPEDHARTEASLLASWERSARDELAESFDRLVASQGYTRASPDRPLQLKVVRDGDPLLGGTAGLQRGEFATALLPNLYLGPVEASAPLVEVFAADPRGRFASIGTLYSDQLAFNVGAHPLDNGCVEALRDSALYTLHRFPGEPGLHHKVHPERADRVVIETGSAHGGETVRLVDRGRDKVLLELMLVAARELDAELPGRDQPRGPRATVGLPGFLPAAHETGTILPEGLDLGTVGAFSIIPEGLPQRVQTLSERAFLLQRILFDKEMAGYHVELDRQGLVGPTVSEPVARFDVADDRVTLVGVARDLAVDGAPLGPGKRLPLRSVIHHITWRGGELEYRQLRRPADPKWPYLARLDAPRRSTPLPEGEVWTIGRAGDLCDVPLPDRQVHSNIRWRDGKTEGPVDVQGGRVDRARFRTDAICVATRAASIDLGGEPILANLSERCPIHVVRGPEVLRLKRGSSLALQEGDELLIGNQAFALLAPGQADVPRPVEQLAPVPEPAAERLQEGPGTRGRRARVGGSPGALVRPEQTYRAALGINPQDAARPPVRAPRIEPVLGAPRPATQLSPLGARPLVASEPAVDVAAAGPSGAVAPAPRDPSSPASSSPAPPPSTSPVSPASSSPPHLALVELDDDPQASAHPPPLFDLPTHQLPSLSLDPTQERWFAGMEDARLEAAATILDEDPDWQALLASAAASVVDEDGPLPPAEPTRECPAQEAPPVAGRSVPRGLRLDVAIPPHERARRLRGPGGLPGFGPLPARRRLAPPTPSLSGE